MSPGDAQKRAAIDLDEVAGKRLSEISAADFLQALEQVQVSGESTTSAEATVGDVLAGAAATQRWGGGFPEKKKVELEKTSMEGLPEKKKVELEKTSMEGLPEKKKVELEKPQIEKQSVELPSDLSTTISRLDDRLATIEEQLSKLSK
jgi:hypothetical protein